LTKACTAKLFSENH